MSTLFSALYLGAVTHRRLRPVRHKLAYDVFSLLLDLDEMPRLVQELALLSHNRFNLFSFRDSDHGAGGNDLRAWVEAQLAAGGINLEGGRIALLASPRMLGYVFNPLSVYFCYRADGHLAAILYEVNNTFGQRHTYLIPVADGAEFPIRQSCAKELYVSPFNDLAMSYQFRVMPPADRIAISIVTQDESGPFLFAAFAGGRRELTDRALAAAFLHFPLLTLKVIAAIHWEAVRLWLKGMRMRPRPAAPARAVTIVPAPSISLSPK